MGCELSCPFQVALSPANTCSLYSHALVLSGCGLPLQIKFQQTGQTILDVIISLLAGAFGFKPSSVPDLTNWVSLKVDRQYSRKALIIWSQRAGLSLLCTLMRQHFLPLTFGKPDVKDQFNIPVKEAACAYSRTLTHNFGKSGRSSNKLSVVGWRNRISSSVTLLLTTEMHNLSFDLVAANPADLKLYQANLSELQRLRTGFTHLCGEPDPAFEVDDATDEADEEAEGHIGILSEHVFPLTQIQLCAAWWLLRVFCLTSSTTSCLIKMFASTIGMDHPLRRAFETVLRFTGNLALLPAEGTDGSVSEGDSAGNGDEESTVDGVASSHLSNKHKSLFHSILQHIE